MCFVLMIFVVIFREDDGRFRVSVSLLFLVFLRLEDLSSMLVNESLCIVKGIVVDSWVLVF